MRLWPAPGNEDQHRRLRESGDPLSVKWIPACAGMTYMARFSGSSRRSRVKRRKDPCSSVKLQLPRFFAPLRMTVFKIRLSLWLPAEAQPLRSHQPPNRAPGS
jgi:hypothetical protein